jgi:anti-sigma factor RsiW
MTQSEKRPGLAHLSPEEIVRYIDHVIEEETRLQVEAHLAGCPACLQEVLEVRRLLRKQIELDPEPHHLE